MGKDLSQFDDGEYTGLRLTAEEFLAIGETRHRYELVDGVVIMSHGSALPCVSPRHSEISLRIIQQLLACADRAGDVRVFAGVDLEVDRTTVFRPDVVAYRGDRVPGEVRRLNFAPDLIVEVPSAETRGLDLVTKRDDYDRFGVAEYWTVDPDAAELRCWRRQGARLREVPIEADVVASSAITGLELDLAPLRKIAGV